MIRGHVYFGCYFSPMDATAMMTGGKNAVNVITRTAGKAKCLLRDENMKSNKEFFLHVKTKKDLS